MADRRCEERVWDNGDTIGCGHPLPCAKHPSVEVAARKALGAIHNEVEKQYRPGETYTDRLRSIARLASDVLSDGGDRG